MKDIVLFIHIFRTGGSSIGKVFLDTLGRPKYVRAHLEQLHKGDDDGVTEIIMGHYPYGTHNFFPRRNCHYVTMLRAPTDRRMSGYFSGRQTDRTMESFIQRARQGHIGGHRNVMTHLVAGCPTAILREGYYAVMEQPITDEDLERAKRNLDTFAYVSLHQHWGKCLRDIQAMFGWPQVGTARENVSRNRPEGVDVPQDVKEIIREKDCYDWELYKYAKRLYGEKFA